MTNEAQMHSVSCMVTLTYDDDHLPPHGQLFKEHLQLFFKRLRKAGARFKYVASGEYGDRSRRPHFHIAFFGMDFSGDRKRYGGSREMPTFRSAELATVWPFGSHLINNLSFEACAYIARYIMKKLKGPNVSPVPLFFDPVSGELILPNPEFLLMSKGIGRSWFNEYFMSDVFPTASVLTAQGTHAPVPRFYKMLLKEFGEDMPLRMSYIQQTRMQSALGDDLGFAESRPDRKLAREAVFKALASHSVRSI